MSMLDYPVLFDGYDIQSVPGITVLAVDAYKPAKRRLGIYDIARAHSSTISSAFYNQKQITVKVAVQGLTRGMAESALDNVLARVQEREKQLVVRQGAGLRSYTATLSDAVTITGGGAYIEVDLIFECSDKFGYNYPDYTLIANVTGITATSRSENFDFEGSAETQAPHIEVKFTAVSATGDASVTIGSQNTGQQITVSRTWSQYDLLIVDSRYKTITVNGADVAFTGAFPEYRRGAQAVYLSTSGFTSHTYNLFAYYHKRYI